MPIVFSARTSTDPGNGLTFGSDGGLLLPSAYVGGAGVSPTYMIDNSWGGPGVSFAYTQPGFAPSAQVAPTLGTAVLAPFAVTRKAKLAGAQIRVGTAVAGSVLYHSLFAADATTGMAAGKLADLCSFNTAVSGLNTATLLGDFTFAARTLYWLASWAYAAAPTIYCRDPQLGAPTRLTAVPTAQLGFNTRIGVGYPDTSAAWHTLTAAPGSVAPVTNTAQSTGWPAYTPLTWWLLTNA